jgi:serine/threonine protein kinase
MNSKIAVNKNHFHF